jgi:hypothetical protein
MNCQCDNCSGSYICYDATYRVAAALGATCLTCSVRKVKCQIGGESARSISQADAGVKTKLVPKGSTEAKKYGLYPLPLRGDAQKKGESRKRKRAQDDSPRKSKKKAKSQTEVIDSDEESARTTDTEPEPTTEATDRDTELVERISDHVMSRVGPLVTYFCSEPRSAYWYAARTVLDMRGFDAEMGFRDTESRLKLARHAREQEVRNFREGKNFAGRKLGAAALRTLREELEEHGLIQPEEEQPEEGPSGDDSAA